MKIGDYETHPAADMFPMLDEECADRLEADVQSNGLIHPIVLYAMDDGDGRKVILDGRNRMVACIAAKVAPQFVDYTGEDPWLFALGANIERRHLTSDQRASICTAIFRGMEAEAQRRKVEGNRLGGVTAGSGRPRNDCVNSLVAELPQTYSEPPKSPAPKTRDRVAAVLQVSPRKVQDAITLFKRDPELLGAVRDGKIALSAARKIADIGDQPAREKAKSDALAGDKKAVRQAVKEAPARVTARKKMPGPSKVTSEVAVRRLESLKSELMRSRPWQGGDAGVVAVLRQWVDEFEGGAL